VAPLVAAAKELAPMETVPEKRVLALPVPAMTQALVLAPGLPRSAFVEPVSAIRQA
jgi:hypothetical protein